MMRDADSEAVVSDISNQDVEEVSFEPSKYISVPRPSTLNSGSHHVVGELITLANGTRIYKRCLSDVKFGVVADDDDQEDNSNTKNDGKKDWLENVLLGQSDLIMGVYEGGFKTWECSIDLVNYLAEQDPSVYCGRRVLELGCGSAIPGMYCLSKGSRVDFQDYNEEVIRLITMPNVLLNTTCGPHDSEIDEKGMYDATLNFEGLNSLNCCFIAGDWGSQNPTGENKYDIILTAETIYESRSHSRLYKLLKRSLGPSGIILIAAKTTYFGCTGSLQSFEQLVRADGYFKWERVRTYPQGVQREIVRLSFM
ncbi:Histidine protein methyltransferase 1 [Chytridiales sp. JEL 0842]|nr:Histidine protein methyltransferase 1 [Chytridiales sp. JEL 0842]